MKLLLITATFASLALAEDALSACGLCKQTIDNFVEASGNTMRMTQMKVSILDMCAGTSHEKDCRKTVSKLDIIAAKLAPFLEDSEAVCNHLQMCNTDGKLNLLSNIALLFWKQAQARTESNTQEILAVCDECEVLSQQAATFFRTEKNKEAAHFIASNYVCTAAGKHAELCTLVANSVIPKIFDELAVLFSDYTAMCSDVKLCQVHSKPIYRPKKVGNSLLEIVRKAGIYNFDGEEELMTCFECTVTVAATLEEMIKNRQETADLLQKDVCGQFPEAWHEGCNDFFHQYLATVLYLTYHQVDGREACQVAKLCEKRADTLKMTKEDRYREGCNQCDHVEHFIAHHSHEAHGHISSMINEVVCQKLPLTLQKACDRVSINIPGVILQALADLASEKKICQAAC